MRKLSIAYGSSCHAKRWVNQQVTFDELCERLSQTVRTPETVEEYPKLPKSERDRAKDKGGFVGGKLKGGRRKRDTVEGRSMLTQDADHAGIGFIDSYEMLCPYASCLYTTHGHTPEAPRVRVVVPLTRDVTPDEYAAISRLFAAEWGIDQFDECSHRPHQLMYWPTTPADGEYVFKRCDGEWLDPDRYLAAHPGWRDCAGLPHSVREGGIVERGRKQQEDPLGKQGVIGAFCRTYGINEAVHVFLKDIYQESELQGRFDYIPADSSAGVVVYDDVFAYSHHATDPACGKLLNAFDLVRIHKFGGLDEKVPEDTEAAKLPSFKAMCDFAVNDENVKMTIAGERMEIAEKEFSGENEDWLKQLEYEKRSTVVKNTLRNLLLILNNDEKLKGIVFNQLSDGMEIKGEVPWEHPSRFWRDADDAQLISYVDLTYGTFSARNYDIAVTKVADDRSYHPIREFLASLPEWDKVPRVDTILVDFLGASDNAYVRAVTRKTLCGAIARVMNPGCKFDTMLVLNGPQGKGKSTLISKLCGEWFNDSLLLNDTKDKTAAEKLQGYWILEIGELAGLKKTEIETLRGFLSRQNDIYRASFGRRATPHPRQCVFIGTTNAENGYLRDTAGNRRFWPVKTPGDAARASWEMTEEEIRQIWAEALVRYKEGEPLHLDNELAGMALKEQQIAMEVDEREGMVRDYLEMPLPERWDKMDIFDRRNYICGSEFGGEREPGVRKRERVCNMEIWCECFGKERGNLKRQDANEISAIMANIEGWKKADNKVRFPIYGIVRGYCRDRETKAKNGNA
nr:virulence-associated E family protein [uncultured Acetatifactor sp.]